MGAPADVADPVGALLLLGSSIFMIAAVYVVCYTFFMSTWEGWESWNRRTGLDVEHAEEERAKRLGLK